MKRASAICSEPDCWKLTKLGKCPRHRRKAARARGYDSKWETFRLTFLLRNPFCARCGVKPMHPHVDHIIDIKAWPSGRLEEINCQTLCQRCHNRKTKGQPGA